MATMTFAFDGTDATQDLTFIASTIGSVSSATDQQRTGPRSLKLAAVADGVVATFVGTPLADAGRRISFGFRFNGALSFNSIMFASTDGTNDVFRVLRNTSNQLVLFALGVTAVTGSTTLSADTWYRVSISYYITNTTTFTFKLYLNGALEATVNSGTLTRTGTSVAVVRSANTGNTYTHWFDDLVIDDGASSSSQTDPGTTSANSLRVTNKRPFANGTTNGFTTQIGAGGSGYGSGHAPQVNEQPLSTTNGWSMVGVGAAVTEEYTIEGPTVGDFSLGGYSVLDSMGWIYAKSLASETGQIVVGGTTTNISLTSTNTLFTKVRGSNLYPSGGTDIGIVTDTTVTTVSLFEAGVLFVINPISPWYYYLNQWLVR